MKSLNEHLNENKKIKLKGKYDIYHAKWSSVLQHIREYLENDNGLEIDETEWDNSVLDAFFKPKPGKTYKFNLTFGKNIIFIQIYNMGEKFELNMYTN
jgi:hypothetical protein